MNITNSIFYQHRYIFAYAVLVFAAIFILLIGLNDIPKGLSSLESEQLNSVTNFTELRNDPTNPLTKLVQLGSLAAFGPTELGLRVGTVIIAIISLVLFFLLLNALYWPKKAIVGVFMLASSSWFLHQARLGDDSISLILCSVGLIYFMNRLHVNRSAWSLVLLFLAVALSLYTPLMIYLLITVSALFYKDILSVYHHMQPKFIAIGSIIATILLLPLIAAIVRDVDVLWKLLNVSDGFISPLKYFINFTDVLSHIFWQSAPNPQLHLKNLPMLDIFTVTMVALGMYSFERDWPSKRSKLTFVSFAVLVLAAALSSSQENYLILAPFIFIFASTGINTLLSQWQSIFPFNPVARTIGIVPLAALLILSLGYNYNRYHQAWAKSPETSAAFDETIPKLNQELQNQYGKYGYVVVEDGRQEHFDYLKFRYKSFNWVTPQGITVDKLNELDFAIIVDPQLSTSELQSNTNFEHVSIYSSDYNGAELFKVLKVK